MESLRWATVVCFFVLTASVAGCDSQTVLGADSGADVDPWVPPVPDAGDPGWRDSTEPWSGTPYVPACEHVDSEGFGSDLLARPEGLYALTTWIESRTVSGGWEDTGGYARIDFDDGGGWRPWDERVCWTVGSIDDRTCVGRLLGIVDGRVAGRSMERSGPSQVRLLSPGTRDAPGAVETWLDMTVVDAVVVRDDLAYALVAGSDAKLIRWDGATWSPDPAVLPYEDVLALWADENNVFVVGSAGTVLSLEGGAWRVHDARSVATMVAVWGFGGDDVWVADTDRGLHHFDGTTWSDVDWPDVAIGDPCGALPTPIGLWGVDGTLFFHVSYQLVRHDASGFTTLAYWPPEFVATTPGGGYCVGGMTILRATGYAPDEAFALVGMPPAADEACRTMPIRPFILRWDGATFHWM